MATRAPEPQPAPPADEARYGWPEADAGDLASRSASIARHLLRSGRRTIGLVPASHALAEGETFGPMLAALGHALVRFTTWSIGLVDRWPTWAWASGEAGEVTDHFRTRALDDRLLEVSPLPCADPEAAALALQAALASLPPTLVTVLVDLSGYAALGLAPAALDVVEGVVLVARARRTPGHNLRHLARQAASKNLGTILLG